MAEEFGVLAKNLRCKVTGEPKTFAWGMVIPCQVGFKQKDSWVNRWVDVKWFNKNGGGPFVSKGDVLTVTGRWNETEWTGNDGNKREGREILADSIVGGIAAKDKQLSNPVNDIDEPPF
jgi:single-stranded DNA-binding protein